MPLVPLGRYCTRDIHTGQKRFHSEPTVQAPAPPGAPKDTGATPSMPEFKKDIHGVKSSICCLAVELEKTMTIVKRSVCKVGFSRRSPCSRDHSRMVDSEVNVDRGLTCLPMFHYNTPCAQMSLGKLVPSAVSHVLLFTDQLDRCALRRPAATSL